MLSSLGSHLCQSTSSRVIGSSFSSARANHLDDLGIGVELGFETLPAVIVPVDKLLKRSLRNIVR